MPLGDPREPAGQDRVRPAVRDRVRAQHGRARAQVGRADASLGARQVAAHAHRRAVHGRTDRTDRLLRDPQPRLGADPGGQLLALAVAQCPAEDRADVRAPDGRQDHQLFEPGHHVPERPLLAAPPGRCGREHEILVEHRTGEARKVGEQRGVLQHRAAQRVDHADRARAHRPHEARDADPRALPQVERVAPLGVDAPQDDVDGFQTLDAPHPDAPLAHQQVGALDERQAQHAREVRLVERRLAARPGGQQDDPRVLRVPRRDVAQSEAQGAEEGPEPLDRRLPVDPGEHLRDDATILHGVPDAAGRLGPVRDRAPLPRCRRARCRWPSSTSSRPPGRRNPSTARSNPGWPSTTVGGSKPVAQQPAPAVRVLKDGVQQLGALHQAGVETGPLGFVDDDRQRVEVPRVVAVGPVRPVRDAVVGEQPLRLVARVGQRRGRRDVRWVREPGPVGRVLEHTVLRTRRGEQVGHKVSLSYRSASGAARGRVSCPTLLDLGCSRTARGAV